MSTSEKLQVMEQLGDDLRRNEAQVPSPEWHGHVLAERERLIAEGQASFRDREVVRKRLADRCHEH